MEKHKKSKEKGLIVLGRWEGTGTGNMGALTEVTFLRLGKTRDGPSYHLQEEYFSAKTARQVYAWHVWTLVFE